MRAPLFLALLFRFSSRAPLRANVGAIRRAIHNALRLRRKTSHRRRPEFRQDQRSFVPWRAAERSWTCGAEKTRNHHDRKSTRRGPAQNQLGRKTRETLGIRFVHIPVSGWSPPTNEQVVQFLSIFRDHPQERFLCIAASAMTAPVFSLLFTGSLLKKFRQSRGYERNVLLRIQRFLASLDERLRPRFSCAPEHGSSARTVSSKRMTFSLALRTGRANSRIRTR